MENNVKFENEADEILPEEKKTSKVGKIINICLTVALFTFIVAFVFRICQSDYKGLKDVNISENFKQAYQINKEAQTHAPGTEFSENGAIYAYSLVYMPKAKYLQITVRYNVRHINEVIDSLNANEIALYGDKARSYTLDDISILFTLTDANGVVYTPAVLENEEKFNYRYFKLEFTDVDFDTNALNINMLIKNVKEDKIGEKNTLVYSQDNEYNSASLQIHTKDNTYIPYEFSKKEKENLSK